MKNNNEHTLWTKDFTIITIGTIVSMLGNSISGFALSLLILDYTGSTLMFAIFNITYFLPKIIMPIVAGPYIDRFSRKKIIYGLDFLSSAIYVLIFFILYFNLINYGLLLILSIIIGSVDSIYQVAYDSFYPTLISEGNYSKAYSISSMIYPLASIMVPVAAYFYQRTGLAPLFIFNAATFFIAAVFETMIKGNESVSSESYKKEYAIKNFIEDFQAGISYIKMEKGLQIITLYFFICTLADGMAGTLLLPYFKSQASLGVQLYTYIMGCAIIGRLIGGLIHYKFKYPKDKKFTIALSVYITSSIIAGTFLYFSVPVMMILNFISGIICVTSYNIRISSTQNYIPDNLRGRFNGTFQMCCTLGVIIGQLLSGILGEFLPIRPILLCAYTFCLGSAILVIYRGKKEVSLIYNKDL